MNPDLHQCIQLRYAVLEVANNLKQTLGIPMNFEFSEEQLMLREQARGFLKQHCPPAIVRKVLDGDEQYDAGLWQQIADMGWTATTIPEEYGGLGLSYYELAVIAEELGRAVAPVPFSSSVYLATEAIIRFGSSEQKNHWLPRLAHNFASVL